MALSAIHSHSHGFPVAVVGAGLTGLAAAHRLTNRGRAVRLLEAAPRVGGVVRTERTSDGWLVETGPNSFQENSRDIAALIGELGLDAEKCIAHPAAKKRFIVRGGRLRAAPTSPPALLTSSLFSPLGKLRLLQDLAFNPAAREADLSLAQLVREHFGGEFLDYALGPFVSGVYAGDAEKLSARHAFPSLWKAEHTHGSLIRGLIAQMRTRRHQGHPRSKLISFRDGLQTLPDALARKLPPGAITLNATVESLRPPFAPDAPWRITWRTPEGATPTEDFSAVILALPAHALAKLVFNTLDHRAISENSLGALADIVHPPVSSLFLGFRREQVAHPLDGFGALVPAQENRRVLGVIFSSSLFPNRAPAGHVALTVMIGGRRQPELAALPAARLVAEAMPDLRALFGVSGEPVFQRHTFWPRAIPQYDVGHEKFLHAIERCEHTYARLFIGGQARDGISGPACLEAGLALADRASR